MKYKAFHKMSYGMYLVATELNGKKSGYIANTAFQVTNSPEQVAISCHKSNQTTDMIREAGAFSVSILKQELDVKLIGNFGFMSGTDMDKFQDVKTQTAKTGMPIVLDECVAWLDCKVTQTVDVGSHWLIIGEVVDSDVVLDEEPLTYKVYREKYKMFSPKNSPTYIERDTLDQEEAEAKKEEEEQKPDVAAKPDAEPHVCLICGYTYDPEVGDPSMGIPPGTPFEDLPDDYKCPICNAAKEYFKKV
ncbi:flavin reductase [uncultured Sunxiuqinia sp.]|jgi:flavin reductase (DIM6/NTAB) family NADH-FMN oxidoreductase RutF/rubredoxin|uniref:flavin reductase n=1 Tax=uncultured Sunxiuqinia sp. TaxID=1573825 RepID=UPI0019CDF6F3|nr:flavin reductase [Sunxiuqinia sp.]|tara:strand:- start:18542 stop:19282 length:741 start_codon:yes stop_codon:yes gene_type:complete